MSAPNGCGIAAQGCVCRDQRACNESRAKTREIGDGGARTAARAAPCNSLGEECGSLASTNGTASRMMCTTRRKRA